MSTADLYLRQMLTGQMANFTYLIGDPQTHRALVVDPAWDIDGLLKVAEDDDYEVVGALVTHYHPDHVGGDIFGLSIEGISKLLEERDVPVHVNKHEADGLRKVTGVSDSELRRVDDGDVLQLGQREIRFVHTPGHTPGSQCFLIDGNLIAGDTLFVQGCGRVDLPGGDPDAMYQSLTGKLAKLPSDTVLYPGHNYGVTPTSTIGDELQNNAYMRVDSLEKWRMLMGMP